MVPNSCRLVGLDFLEIAKADEQGVKIFGLAPLKFLVLLFCTFKNQSSSNRF